jgi:hypothetical protein
VDRKRCADPGDLNPCALRSLGAFARVSSQPNCSFLDLGRASWRGQVLIKPLHRRQAVGDDRGRAHPGFTQEFSHEALGSTLISPRLHEDVEHLALGIDGAPEIQLFLSKPVTRDSDIITFAHMDEVCVKLRIGVPTRCVESVDRSVHAVLADFGNTAAKPATRTATLRLVTIFF